MRTTYDPTAKTSSNTKGKGYANPVLDVIHKIMRRVYDVEYGGFVTDYHSVPPCPQIDRLIDHSLIVWPPTNRPSVLFVISTYLETD